MTNEAIQTMLIYTEGSQKPHILYSTAEDVLAIIDEPGVVKYNGEITKFNLLSKDCPTIITGASYWTPISEQELVLLL